MENNPQQHGGFLTSTDPQAEGVGVIQLNHYPLPHMFRSAEQEAAKQRVGPIALAGVEMLFYMRYGNMLDFLKTKVGLCLHYMTLGRMAVTVKSWVEDIEANKVESHREVMPLPVLYFSRLFQVVHSYRDPAMTMDACAAFVHFLGAIDPFPEVVAMMEPLMEPISALYSAEGVISDEALKQWRIFFRRAEYRYALPLVAIIMALEEFGDDAVNVHLSPRSENGEPVIEAVSEAPNEAQEPSAEEVFAEHEEKFVEHLDGSKGLNARTECQALFRFSGDFIEDVEEQYTASLIRLAGMDPSYLRAIKLWWKTHRSKHDQIVALGQARLVVAAARTLEKLFEPEEMRHLETRIHMQEMVEMLVQYIASYEQNPPAMSWSQIRINMLSIPMHRMAFLGGVNPLDYAVQLFEELGRGDEIPLLRATIDIQEENLDNMIRRQTTDPKLHVKH